MMAKKELTVFERFQAAQVEVFELSKAAQEAQDKFLEKRTELISIMKELPPEVRSVYSAPQAMSGGGTAVARPKRVIRESIDSADLARVKKRIADELTDEGRKFLAAERRELAGDLEVFKAAMAELLEEGKARKDPNGPDRGIGMQFLRG
jgi:hypothetical protein